MAAEGDTDVLYRGVWTCNNDDLPESEEHVMGESEVESLSELAEDFTYHYHGNCLDCEAYNAHFEGNLDRVEKVRGGDVVETLDAESVVEEYGMTRF